MSVRAARTFVCARLLALGWPTFVDAAGLAVTELATNVVLHARTDFRVQVSRLDAKRVRVSVTDASTAAPVVQTPEPGSALGRGLRLVAQMTDAWGVGRLGVDDEGGPGKTVWFELGSAGRPGGRATASADYDPTVPDLLNVSPVPPAALREVKLLNMPLRLFARETSRHTPCITVPPIPRRCETAVSNRRPSRHAPRPSRQHGLSTVRGDGAVGA